MQRSALPLALAFCAVPVFAQSTRSTLTGTVTDSTGRSLQGAQVTVNPGDFTAATNADGAYTFPGLAAGSYSVTVSYQGFSPQTQTVVLSEEPGRVNFSLAVASSSASVNVRAGREGGEVEAINRTLTADNIINVLPADVIISLPNANVADAIGRLPSVTLERDEGEGKYVKVRGTEPRLTSTTLDGVVIASPESVRQIKLDLIPADLVESVQINKTLQANMEGDGIGGSVDLRTKSAQDLPTVFLEGTGGYTPIIQGRPAYQFDGTYGRRFLEGKRLGALISASYDWNGRGINDVEPGPAIFGTYDLREYRYFRSRYGLGGTVDYRFSDTSNIQLKYLYSHFRNFGDDWIYSPTINTFLTPTQGSNDGTITFNALRRRPVQDIGGMQLGGHSIVKTALLNYDVDASVARTRDAGYANSSFAPVDPNNPLNNITYSLNVSNPLIPKITPNGPSSGLNVFDPTKFFLLGTSNQFFYSPEVDLGFGASMVLPYSLGGHSSTFEFGGRFRNEHKFANQNTQVTTPNTAGTEDPAFAMTRFLRTDFADPNYYGGAYGPFGPTVDVDQVLAAGGQSTKGRTVGNSFDQVEKVSAGYAMNTTTFGRYRVYLGLRTEATGENNLGYIGARNANGVGTTANRVTSSYISLLPSASVRYALTPASGIRLVYGRGLSRPNFSDLIPFVSDLNPPTATTVVSRGNPNLRTEYGDDIDLLYESALEYQGLLQAGFFYKHLSDPIVPTQSVVPNTSTAPGAPPTYRLQQTINAGSAYVYGFEIAFQQRFTYLPGLLNGFGFSGNYAYTGSEATLPNNQTSASAGSTIHPLIGQAANSYNVSPTYDKGRLSVRLGLTYNGPNIAAYGDGTTGPNGDNYFYSHLQVDLQGTYNLPKGFQFVAYGLNLNNEVFGFYNGDPQYPVQREFYRQTVGGGLRWSPHRASR